MIFENEVALKRPSQVAYEADFRIAGIEHACKYSYSGVKESTFETQALSFLPGVAGCDDWCRLWKRSHGNTRPRPIQSGSRYIDSNFDLLAYRRLEVVYT